MTIFTYVLHFVVCPISHYFDTDRRISFDTDVLPMLPLAKTQTHTHTQDAYDSPYKRQQASSRNPDVVPKFPFGELYCGDMEMLHC